VYFILLNKVYFIFCRKADVDTESKFNLFRQTLWHWRSSLHLKNTLFTLVEAGCVALQHRFLQQVRMFSHRHDIDMSYLANTVTSS